MLRFFSVMIIILALTGCQKKLLYSGIDQAQANEMIVVLNNLNISAEKKPVGNDTWEVLVPVEVFPLAIEALKREGLPRNSYSGLGEVFEKKGMISSPVEERARYAYAMSQELSETLSSIQGVISARVHISLPKEDILAARATPSSASVLITHKPGYDFSTRLVSIKSLVVNSVEGLKYDNVSVAFFEGPSFAPISEQTLSNKQQFNFVYLLGIMVVIVLCTFFLLTLYQKLRQHPQRNSKV
ncbi:MAG: type III secretion inner membrane ring lipoprotein SctJ [Aquisalinus sp.]|nr:type III secretion inner membrane ring lipoprotein SctJ [Aquisalinus sp.]